jgi:DegT/DnrJ/EryC1/StrS aminotransferase family protein
VRGRTNAVEVARLLTAEGVPAAPMYPAWHRTAAYLNSTPLSQAPTAVAQDAARNVVWLHHRLLLDGAAGMDDIVTALAKVMGHIRARPEAGEV